MEEEEEREEEEGTAGSAGDGRIRGGSPAQAEGKMRNPLKMLSASVPW